MPPMKKGKRGPAPKLLPLEVHVDLLEQYPRNGKNLKMIFTNVQYHIIKNETLNVNLSYNNLVEEISSFASKIILNKHPDCHYELVHLPISTVFGQSEVRKKVTRRNTNDVMANTPDYVSEYIKNYGIVLDTKIKRTKAGVDKRKLSTVVAAKIGIDVAVVVRIVPNTTIPDIKNVQHDDENKEDLKMPPLKKKKKETFLFIPRQLEINVLNHVMSVTNKRECGVTYTPSSSNAVATVIFDLEDYIDPLFMEQTIT